MCWTVNDAAAGLCNWNILDFSYRLYPFRVEPMRTWNNNAGLRSKPGRFRKAGIYPYLYTPRLPTLFMDTTTAWESLPGKTYEEKLGSLGVTGGENLDIRMLDEISRTYGIRAFLFFEEDLARRRTLESILEEFEIFPEYGRPYIRIGSFLRFARENDPSFEQTMREFPLMIEIVTIGEMQEPVSGKTILYITGLMPFLDELDVDADPVM
jgi:hypothetical protein